MGIQFKEVNYRYRALNDKDRVEALHNINLNLEGKGEFIFICGQTGSGKTTLVQHMNALLQPSSGEVSIFDSTVYAHKKNTKLNAIRKRVGLVFQFPEYQLFEETNLKDIMFGPRNFGLDKVEAEKKARFAAELVGIDEALLAKSPFKISGGQMRRIAIAGILAMEPEILVLDEPTRGLDPQGQKEIMGLFHRIHSDLGKTIVVTGSFPQVDRDTLVAHLTSLGAKVSGSVSTKTSYVVAGDEAGKKLSTAIALGVPVLQGDELHKQSWWTFNG